MGSLTYKPVSRMRAMISASAAIALGSVAVCAWSAGARAGDRSDDVLRYTINYADLDLATESGARTLYRRIVAAAHRVCPGESSRELSEVSASGTCREAAVARAMSEVHTRELALARAVHEPQS